MLKTGAQHLESLRDGRVVYIGSERVNDVTAHPAFKNAAKSFADLYDMKAAPEQRDAFAFEEDGEHFSAYFLKAKTRSDLEKRSSLHRAIARSSYGLLGRSPDHVASFVTAMTTNATLFGQYADNINSYYDYLRKTDAYAVYAVVPIQQATRQPDFYAKRGQQNPALRVVGEYDGGLIISGMKMLGTGAVFANEIWIGNLIPLSPDQGSESITCAVPVNAPGVTLWSRKPFERDATVEFENPLAYRFDETDSMVLCNEVKVPWERVFVHNDTNLARQIYVDTPAHCYGNHQSNVRFHEKLRLIVGLAAKVTQASGVDQIPAVREVLGRLAAQEATLGGMIAGQIHDAEHWPASYLTYNRRYMYAALNWCTENYSPIIDTLRELCGGGVFQMPADISVLQDPILGRQFEDNWRTPQHEAVDRMKIFKLVWDLVGSEFAGRHQQYEKFYAGASFIIKGHNFRVAPWAEWGNSVDELLNSYSHSQGDTTAPKEYEVKVEVAV